MGSPEQTLSPALGLGSGSGTNPPWRPPAPAGRYPPAASVGVTGRGMLREVGGGGMLICASQGRGWGGIRSGVRGGLSLGCCWQPPPQLWVPGLGSVFGALRVLRCPIPLFPALYPLFVSLHLAADALSLPGHSFFLLLLSSPHSAFAKHIKCASALYFPCQFVSGLEFFISLFFFFFPLPVLPRRRRLSFSGFLLRVCF